MRRPFTVSQGDTEKLWTGMVEREQAFASGAMPANIADARRIWRWRSRDYVKRGYMVQVLGRNWRYLFGLRALAVKYR